LFLPFAQLDSRLSRQYAGTGLGLTLVKRMAHMLEGQVAVESELNRGSRFTLRIPWRREPSAQAARQQALPALFASPFAQSANPGLEPGLPPPTVAAAVSRSSSVAPVILLVEDNPINTTMMKDYLLQKGFQVLVATHGEEAISAVKYHTPDLILMDVQMPGMDGLEATRRIKADPRFRLLPIIALTALAMPGDRERCLAAGADGYFAKPSRLADLIGVIRQHLQKRS